MFMLLLWLFPRSWHTLPWRSKIPCMSKRVAHATLIFLSLTTLCDAKDKTELIFMAGNSRHSSSNKWDALHKASWRSLKIIVLERRFFETKITTRKEIEWRRLCKGWLQILWLYSLRRLRILWTKISSSQMWLISSVRTFRSIKYASWFRILCERVW